MSELEAPTGAAYEAELQVHRGPSAGECHLIARFPVDIGRGQDAAVRLRDDPADPRLSRRHARLALQGGWLTVTDLSTNGTWVGDVQLTPGETRVVSEGEPIWLGRHTMFTVRRVLSGDESTAADAPPEAAHPPGSAGTVPASGHGQLGSGRLLQDGANAESAPVTGDGGARVDPQQRLEHVPGAAAPLKLAVRALGTFDATVGAILIAADAWQARKAVLVLAFLCDSAGRPVPVERLESTLWPDAEDGARQAMQTAVSRIRRAFRTVPAPDPVVFERECYAISPAYELSWDVAAFERACDRAQRGEEDPGTALAAYRGPFLEGYNEDWAASRRRTLQNRYLDVLQLAAARCEHDGLPQDAIRLLETAVDADPCCERAQAALLRCLSATGRRDEAMRRYQTCVRALQRTLGVTPGPELLAWHASLREGGQRM